MQPAAHPAVPCVHVEDARGVSHVHVRQGLKARARGRESQNLLMSRPQSLGVSRTSMIQEESLAQLLGGAGFRSRLGVVRG
jgi:hypothetical protein